ncbi:hypothetical protein ES705_10549 [subsurface metagenome]
MPGMAAADRFVGCYLLNEGSGIKAYDSSGRRHTGVLTGGVSWTSGKYGGAIALNKAAFGHIVIADHADFSPVLMPYSVSMSVKMNDATQFPLVSKGVPGVDSEYRFFLGGTDKAYCNFYTESTTKYIGRLHDTALTIYQSLWVNFVMTYDGGVLSSGLKIYLNGLQIDDTDHEAPVFTGVEDQAGPVLIGRRNANYADGDFDYVMIWNCAPSAYEIDRLIREPFYMFPEPVRPEIIIAA